MGVLLLVAVVIVAMVATPLGGSIADGAAAAICRIAGGDCESDDAREARTGEPALVDCIRSSYKRGINGAVKIAVVKFGGGVEGVLEVRADGTAKVLINGNAKAGLEFAPPTVEVDAGNTEVGAGEREFGISGKGETKVAITYDRDGKMKTMRVLGTLDVTATENLKASIEGKDLKQFVESAQKAKGGASEQAGGRVIFDASLDLRDPANAAAAQAFIHEPGIDSAVDLYDRFEDSATVNARFYSLSREKVDAGLDLGVFAVSGEYTAEDAALLDAYYRDRATGGFKQWEACVRGQT